jgi:hypothetical protein
MRRNSLSQFLSSIENEKIEKILFLEMPIRHGIMAWHYGMEFWQGIAACDNGMALWHLIMELCWIKSFK